MALSDLLGDLYHGAQVRAHQRSRRLHEGRRPQPGIPEGPRNAGFQNPFDAFDGDRFQRTAAATLQMPERLQTPETAASNAVLHGIQPPAVLQREFKREYPNRPALFDQITKAAVEKTASEENLGEPSDLTDLILTLATGGGALYLKGALKGGELAAGAAEGALGGEAASSAPSATSGLTRLLQGAAKTATFPVRHPIVASAGATFGAQAPLAVGRRDPREFTKALEGTGVLATALAGAGKEVSGAVGGVPGNALGDLLSLPAQVVPSLYLTGKAGVKAATGDTGEAKNLINEYLQTSALPALATGHIGEALSRAGEHPLYTLLEGAAVKAGLGRGIGRVARGGEAPEVRPDLNVYGDINMPQGRYSRDWFAEQRQRRKDARRPEAPGEGSAREMTPRERARYLRRGVDREMYGSVQVGRKYLDDLENAMHDVKPADSQTDVVSHAIQGISRNPDRAVFDLQDYRDQLLDQQRSGHLTPSELESNRRQVDALEAAIASPDPDGIYKAVRTFVEHQRPISEGLAERGLLDPEQARKSIAIPYARTHMDSRYGISRADEAELAKVDAGLKEQGRTPQERGQLLGRRNQLLAKRQTLDANGDPLSTDAIEAHMRENGVEPADLGFITQRAGALDGPSVFWKRNNERPDLHTQRRTGEATTRGTFDAGWDNVVRQLLHDRTILSTVQAFENVVDRFGLRAPDGRAFGNRDEGLRAAAHPEDFGMTLPDVPGGWVPIRKTPWPSKEAAMDATKDLGQNHALESDQVQAADNLGLESMRKALEPGDGEVVLMPKAVVDRWNAHQQAALPTEKAIQTVTNTLKSTWLPFSVKWLTGNAVDNYVVRAFGTGITPRDMVTGGRLTHLYDKVMSPEEKNRALESIVPGGLGASRRRIDPHRSWEQFVGTSIEPLARAGHAVLVKPGIRTAHALFRRYVDTVFELDSKYIEQTPQYGQLAKATRQELGMTRRQFREAIKAEDPVLMDFLRGQRNPEKIDHMARKIEDVFGNWGKNSPEARRYLNSYAPFWMWGRSALRFALMTLPRDHPMLTGILAATEQMTREERQKLGLDFDGDEPVPGFLQGGIPGPGGGVVSGAGLTTFSVFSDLPQFLANSVTPQAASAINALEGMDWKGDKLVDSEGRPASDQEKALAAVRGTAESFVPFLNTAKSISGHGAAGALPTREYPPSTVDFLREQENSQTIHVPISGSGGSSSASPSANPFDALDGQLEASNPFDLLDAP